MQIGEKRVFRLQHGPLFGLGLLDLDDQLCGIENLPGRLKNSRSGLPIILVGKANGEASSGFHKHLMIVAAQLMNGSGCHAYTVFAVLDFPGYTDPHTQPPDHSGFAGV